MIWVLATNLDMNFPFVRTKRQSCRKRRKAGFTLVEMMVGIVVLVLVVLALTNANLLGMREDQLVESKGGASDTSRKVLNKLPTDIKSSKMWFLGNMTGGTNFAIATNASQGTAIKLFETTNNSAYIIYYFDLSNSNNSDGHLLRTTNTAMAPQLLATNLVNWLGGGYSFTCEDYNGFATNNYGTSTSYKRVIHTKLQFCQFQYPTTTVGSNGLYDYYKIEFKATPHLPE
jgi:prepilin-type N-terminal cleavage/methylation domain-containing protein